MVGYFGVFFLDEGKVKAFKKKLYFFFKYKNQWEFTSNLLFLTKVS